LRFFLKGKIIKITNDMKNISDHVAPWVEKWGHGMALLGEQGVEGIHKELGRIEHTRSSMNSDTEQYMSIMKLHHLRLRPSLQEHIIPPNAENSQKRNLY
ncbi:unnamed protein product, partial [Owenia fusiformis]